VQVNAEVALQVEVSRVVEDKRRRDGGRAEKKGPVATRNRRSGRHAGHVLRSKRGIGR
jgi:hypothetical protein